MQNSKIEWTDFTWNPVTGCSPISEGCANCYARRMAKRLAGRFGYPEGDGFKVTLHRDKLDEPTKKKKPCKIFVCSMGDLFHYEVSEYYIQSIFNIMANNPRHTFMVLTKRPEEIDRLMSMDILRNVSVDNIWVGTSIENQEAFDERIPHLLKIPAFNKFVSFEPLLGPINFHSILASTRIRAFLSKGCVELVIAGGETGPNARPMHPDWIRGIRDQCIEIKTPFFFKSWGEWGLGDPFGEAPVAYIDRGGRIVRPSKGCLYASKDDFPEGSDASDGWEMVGRVGKKAAGRLLDGQEWNGLND